MICSAIVGVGGGRSAIPAPKAANATTIAAAAANIAVRQRDRRAVSGCTPASTAARSRSGGSAAVAAETTAIVSRTARTSSSKAPATVAGAAASCRSMAARSLSETACSAYGVASSSRSNVGRLGHVTPRQPRRPRNASRIRDLIVDRLADNRCETSAYVNPP